MAGVIAVVGGEGVAQPDPARLIALAVDPIAGQYGLGRAMQVITIKSRVQSAYGFSA